jgi:hypothetical protein
MMCRNTLRVMGRSAGIRRPRWRAFPGGGPHGPSPLNTNSASGIPSPPPGAELAEGAVAPVAAAPSLPSLYFYYRLNRATRYAY